MASVYRQMEMSRCAFYSEHFFNIFCYKLIDNGEKGLL